MELFSRKQHLIVFYFILLVIVVNSYSQEQIIDKKLYKQIKSVSLEILKRCPPDDCVVIGIGRSPTPFMTFIKHFAPDSMNIPLTDYKDHINELTDRKMKSLFNHFDNYIDKTKLSGKRVVIIDYVSSGDGLFAAYTSLEKYMNRNKIGISIWPLAIGENSKYDTFRIMESAHKYGVKEFDGIKVYGDLYRKLWGSFFEDYAEYKSATVNEWGNVKRNFTAYNQYRDAMLLQIKNDPKLIGKTLDDILSSPVTLFFKSCLERISKGLQ